MRGDVSDGDIVVETIPYLDAGGGRRCRQRNLLEGGKEGFVAGREFAELPRRIQRVRLTKEARETGLVQGYSHEATVAFVALSSDVGR